MVQAVEILYYVYELSTTNKTYAYLSYFLISIRLGAHPFALLKLTIHYDQLRAVVGHVICRGRVLLYTRACYGRRSSYREQSDIHSHRRFPMEV